MNARMRLHEEITSGSSKACLYFYIVLACAAYKSTVYLNAMFRNALLLHDSQHPFWVMLFIIVWRFRVTDPVLMDFKLISRNSLFFSSQRKIAVEALTSQKTVFELLDFVLLKWKRSVIIRDSNLFTF